MSTVLINTEGQSAFKSSTDLMSMDYGPFRAIQGLAGGNLTLTDQDKKPMLVPQAGMIDVVNNFSWYAGPKSTPAALNKVPCIFLTEREQLLSSLISGAMYYLNTGLNAFTDVTNRISQITSLNASLKGDTLRDLKSIAGVTGGDAKLLEGHNLKSLQGIYFTKETGFRYRLPQYDQQTQVKGEWASGGGSSLIRKAVDSVQGAVDTVSETVNFAQPGVYIEKPQYFQGASTGKTQKVSFPLSNTIRRGTVSPIQQNYELLWLLAFQNKPYRTSFSRTPPPKIYTATCPGRFSMPYAYISNMAVEFVGTVRNTTVSVPCGNGDGPITSKKVNVPVPEAYQVTIDFTSLIGEYGNTMLSDAFNTSITGDKITVGRMP